jgi:hypothetical protein
MTRANILATVIAGLFLATAGAALAQVDDNPCKGLDRETCCANAACTWVHMLMPGEVAVERCQRRRAPMHPRALSMSTGCPKAPSPRRP